MLNRPPVGGETQPIMRMVDDLPAPFGPRNPNASPRETSRSMPRTASKSPNFLASSRAFTNCPPPPTGGRGRGKPRPDRMVSPSAPGPDPPAPTPDDQQDPAGGE